MKIFCLSILFLFFLYPIVNAQFAPWEYTDPRDGQIYLCKFFHNTTFMLKNINYKTDTGSYCYDNDTNNCRIYGRLYTVETAKKACPPGWHVANVQDWTILMHNTGSYTDISSLKDYGKNGFTRPSNLSFGESGFNAMPAGCLYINEDDGEKEFLGKGKFAPFWASTEYNDTIKRTNSIIISESNNFNSSVSSIKNAFSVRCAK